MHVPRIKPCFKACTEACFTCFTNSTYIFFFSSKTVHINLITPLITLSLSSGTNGKSLCNGCKYTG